MWTRILLCVDDTGPAMGAARVAGWLAQRTGASLTALHVSNLPVVDPGRVTCPPFGRGAEPISRLTQEEHKAVRARLEPVLGDWGVAYDFVGRNGDVVAAIIACAKAGAYDLIVLGSRGLSELRSFLVGGVSDRVMHLAPCAVLIAREPTRAARPIPDAREGTRAEPAEVGRGRERSTAG